MLHHDLIIVAKDGKEPLLRPSYRPFCLLHGDIRSFGKILANRLIKMVQPLGYLDQEGFLTTREARDNTVHVQNPAHQARVGGRLLCSYPQTHRRPSIGEIGTLWRWYGDIWDWEIIC